MADPAEALQAAVKAALSADSALLTLIGGSNRIHDRVPTGPQFPYLRIGEDEILDDGHSCDEEASEAFVIVHAYTRSVGKPECKRIGARVRAALAGELTVAGQRCVTARFDAARYFTEPDGLTEHAVLRFRYQFEPE